MDVESLGSIGSNVTNESLAIVETPYKLENFDEQPGWIVIQVMYLAFVWLYILVVDIRIVWVVFTNEVLLTSANICFCDYLATDIITVTAYLIFFIHVISGSGNAPPVNGYCAVQAFAMQALTLHCICLLLLLSVEKVIYIIYPFKHIRWFTIRKTKIYAVVAAISMCVVALSVMISFGYNFDSSALSCLINLQNSYNKSSEGIFSSISLLMNSMVLYGGLISVALCHITIFFHAFKHRRSIKLRTQSPDDRIVTEMFKKAFTIFLIVIVFWLTWIPYLVIYFQRNAILRRISVFVLVTVSPVLNPLIILKGNRPLRERLKPFFQIHPLETLATTSNISSTNTQSVNVAVTKVKTVSISESVTSSHI